MIADMLISLLSWKRKKVAPRQYQPTKFIVIAPRERWTAVRLNYHLGWQRSMDCELVVMDLSTPWWPVHDYPEAVPFP